MNKLSAPQVRFDSGVFIVELGEEFASLYEIKLDQLQLLPMLARSVSPARVVVDMSHVKFIGSAIIGLFVEVSKSLSNRGGTFVLLNANKYCQTVISMAKLSSMLPSYGPVDKAEAPEASVAEIVKPVTSKLPESSSLAGL